MKRKLGPILILLLIAVFRASAVSDKNITLSYRQLVGSRDLEIRIKDKYVILDMDLRQYKDGHFILQTPPFPVIQIDNRLHVGELRPSNLLRLIADPMTTEQTALGFNRNKNLQKITNPTQNPSLSGIALTANWFEAYLFSPVLNPDSPLGQGIIMGNSRVFAGLMHIKAAEKKTKAVSQDLMLDWSSLSIGNGMLFTLLGASMSGTTGNIEIRSQIFLQNAWDPYLGGGSSTGWKLQVRTEKANLAMDCRQGGKGVHLAPRVADNIPKHVISFDLDTASGLGFSYGSDLYGEPVFGGTSQRRDITYTVVYRNSHLHISTSHKRNYEKDKGVISYTAHSVETELGACSIKSGFTILRDTEGEPVACGFSLDLKAPNCNLEIKNGKTTLELSWKRKFEDCTLTLSVNQDRYVSASLSMEGF